LASALAGTASIFMTDMALTAAPFAVEVPARGELSTRR
jgi:hypothetical protein